MNTTMIDRYEAGATLPVKAIDGLTEAEWDATPGPGDWSVRQVILHLMDSDLIASDRMKRVIAESNPALHAYDASVFARSLFYDRLDPVGACEMFRLNRRLTAAILRALPAEAFLRTGVHSERGVESLARIVEIYTDHLDHHVNFIREKRARLGEPMA